MWGIDGAFIIAIVFSVIAFFIAVFRFVKWCIKKYKLKKRIEKEDGVLRWL